jgi:hypothetical protein
VGIEACEDLQADLAAALERTAAALPKSSRTEQLEAAAC